MNSIPFLNAYQPHSFSLRSLYAQYNSACCQLCLEHHSFRATV